jgi:uncharacterized protein (DUF1778 family)
MLVAGLVITGGFLLVALLAPKAASWSTASVASYVVSTYTALVDTKTERWTLRVTPAQDTLMRRVLKATGMSLNEYVVSHAVAAAAADLADRQVFALDPAAWSELQEVLDRPASPKPKIAALLREPSVLEHE